MDFSGNKTWEISQSRKARNCSSPYPSSEKPTSRKDKLHRMPKTVSETLVCMQKSENIAKAVQSRRTQNIGTDFLANDTSKVHEALASKPKADENTNAASVNNNYPDAGAISSKF